MPLKTTNRYIFLDRDGTIIKDHGYVHKISDLEFLPGAISGLQKFKKLGYKFIIVSNQAGIARNYYDIETVNRFNDEIILQLASCSIRIEKIYICPHHPDFTGDCSCRKPKPGLAKLAAKEFGIDLKKSIFIGDKDSDIQFGKNCKGITVLIKNNKYSNSISPDFKVSNLKEATKILPQEKI